MRNKTNKCIYRYSVYCIINSVACYMFRPHIVAIFREMFFEECVIWKIKIISFTDIKC